MDYKELTNSELEVLVPYFDRSLSFKDRIGSGTFGEVVRVNNSNQEFALKIKKDGPCLTKEYEIQKSLEGIEGIPKVLDIYEDGNAMLMEYVDSEELYFAGSQPESFFKKLEWIVEGINGEGITLAEDIINGANVLVDVAGNPWIVDFMYSREICRGEFEVQRMLSIAYIDILREAYCNGSFEDGV